MCCVFTKNVQTVTHLEISCCFACNMEEYSTHAVYFHCNTQIYNKMFINRCDNRDTSFLHWYTLYNKYKYIFQSDIANSNRFHISIHRNSKKNSHKTLNKSNLFFCKKIKIKSITNFENVCTVHCTWIKQMSSLTEMLVQFCTQVVLNSTVARSALYLVQICTVFVQIHIHTKNVCEIVLFWAHLYESSTDLATILFGTI